jgi:hypothetical protein
MPGGVAASVVAGRIRYIIRLMDLLYFLRARTKFVRYVYQTTVPQFDEIQRKIEAGEEPFVDRRYWEADEPAFLAEWEEADPVVSNNSNRRYAPGPSTQSRWSGFFLEWRGVAEMGSNHLKTVSGGAAMGWHLSSGAPGVPESGPASPR